MAQVKIIAPQTREAEHLRVAAYCRVSSDSKDQLHSYAAQIRNYTEEIAQHDGWELVDVYADEGLTGTRMDQRDDFNRMMRDCRKGKLGVLRNFLDNASELVSRRTVGEIRIRSTVDVRSMQKEVDRMSKELRELDEKIQEANWTTELLEG